MFKIKAIFIFSLVSLQYSTFGQSFKVPHDSIFSYISRNENIHNDVINLTNDTIKIDWKVIASDFPQTWYENIGICDNVSCYSNENNVLLSGTSFTTSDIFPFDTCNFYLMLNLFSAPPGTHFLTVQFKRNLEMKNATWMVSRNITGVTSVFKTQNQVNIYPNPSNGEINIFSNSSEAHYFDLIDIFGKLLFQENLKEGVNPPINIDNLSKGFYFVKIYNKAGYIISTQNVVIN